MMNHLSEDNIQGHFTRKLFFVMVFMLVRSLFEFVTICTILAAAVEINIGTKEK